METLLSEIEAFCAARDVSPTRFGEMAMGDRNFVHDLRKRGRRVWPENADKVRLFMASYREEAA